LPGEKLSDDFLALIKTIAALEALSFKYYSPSLRKCEQVVMLSYPERSPSILRIKNRHLLGSINEVNFSHAV